MKLSIIIVNYKTWEHLDRCLGTLLVPVDGTAEGEWTELEIIVVDNDDDELSRQHRNRMVAAYPDVTFLVNDGNYGFAHGCNTGARQATGELLLFLNPDVKAKRNEVERLIEEKRNHPEVSILAPSQVDSRGRSTKAFDVFPGPLRSFGLVRTLLRFLRPSRYPHPRARHNKLVRCDWVSGSALLISRDDFCQLGGWSEDFWLYMEDVDFCRRARDRDMVIAFTPKAQFEHNHGAASRRAPEIEVLARSEAIISRHVYVSLHFKGGNAGLFHAAVIVKTLVPLTIYLLFDLLTFRLLPMLRIRSCMLLTLVRYYLRRLSTGCWLSRRSPSYQRTKSTADGARGELPGPPQSSNG